MPVRPVAVFPDGELPVMLALSRQHEPLACLLVRQGCDIDTDSRSGHGLLSVAVEHGCLEFAKLVLSRGYDVNKVKSTLTEQTYSQEINTLNITGSFIVTPMGDKARFLQKYGWVFK